MTNKIPRLCECDSFNCHLKVELAWEEALAIGSQRVVIVKGCKVGPSPGDKLEWQTHEYDVYTPEGAIQSQQESASCYIDSIIERKRKIAEEDKNLPWPMQRFAASGSDSIENIDK